MKRLQKQHEQNIRQKERSSIRDEIRWEKTRCKETWTRRGRTFLMTSGPRKTTAAAAAPARKIPSTATFAHHRIARHRSSLGHSPSSFTASLIASTSSGILMYSPRPHPAPPAPDIPMGRTRSSEHAQGDTPPDLLGAELVRAKPNLARAGRISGMLCAIEER